MSNARNLAKVAVDANGDIGTASLDNIDLTTRVAKTGDTMTGNLIVNASVGVGTSSPAYKLDARLSDTSSGAVIQVGNTGSGGFGGLGVSDGGTYPLQIWGSSLAFLSGNSSYASATERMRIDSAGRVTMPYQPCFSVKENGSSSYTNGQYAKLDSIEVNVGGGYNASTGLFTAPVAGNYLITSQLMTFAGTGRAIYYLYKNGTQYMEASASSTDYNDAQATTIMYLSAGDTCGIVVGSGSYYGSSQTQNFFCGHLIG